MLLLPGGVLRASVWDSEIRETVMRDVAEDLPFFLRTTVRMHDQVTLRDLLLLAEQHRDFLLPLFTDLLDDFVEEVKRPVEPDELCELDYLEITWESLSRGNRFDLQPILVGRNHEDPQVYSVEAVPTYAMGHLPVLLRGEFDLRVGGDVRPDRGAHIGPSRPGATDHGPVGHGSTPLDAARVSDAVAKAMGLDEGQLGDDGLNGAAHNGTESNGAAHNGTESNGAAHNGADAAEEIPSTPEPMTYQYRRDFLLFDVFEAVLAEITFHGDPAERDRWWREVGSRKLDGSDRPEGSDE